MHVKKLLTFVLAGVLLSSCGLHKAEAAKVVPDEILAPDTTEIDKNEAVDLRKPEFRSTEDDEEEDEAFVVDKVILHYYNEDGNCANPGTAGRAFFVWCTGFDGLEYSNEVNTSYKDAENHDVDRVAYSADGTMMTITIDLINDPDFSKFYPTSSIMYIIKYKMQNESNLNWGGQSEDVELKFSEFPPDTNRVVEVWSTPAAGGGIAQFDSEEKTKVEGVKLAKFTDWKTITCTLSAKATDVTWMLYAFDETYFKVKAKNRAGIKKNYLVKEGTSKSATFTIQFQNYAHINAVYSIDSYDVNGTEVNGQKLRKTVYVSFEDLYGTPRFEKYYNYTGNDLGVTYTSSQTTFKVWSPVAANISLYLYNSDTSSAYDGADKYKGWHMNYTEHGVWTLTVLGDLAHDEYKYFNYYVDTWSTSGTCMDPYATGCGACGLRGLVYDKTETNPADWGSFSVPALDTPQKLTIYEVHVQDFTGDESWGGPEEERGTYNGFVRTGTRLPSDNTVTTGFDHLKELGVGAVQFVPVFDSDNDEVKNTKYNWGYNPLNYNCVEGAYSSNPHDGKVRISEFKNMVNELAKAGMRTIMDVVYNHVSSPTASCFNKLMPRYYFRYAKAGDAEVNLNWIQPGELYDGSGCHNEFKSEATMARKYIVDSVCMWAREYNVKGFRFDLMALIDGYTLKDVKKELYKIDPSIYVYGEGWTADRFHGKKTWYDLNGDGVINYATETEHVDSFGAFAVPGGDEHNLHNNHGYQVYSELYNEEDEHSCWLGAFDGSGRDALKGDNNPGYGFINKGRGDLNDGFRTSLENIIYGKRADGEGANPKQVVQYASCHDNYTLRDHLYATLGGAEAPYLIDVLHGVMAVETLVFASNSAAFMLGGEELLRTKEVIFDAEHPNAASNNVTAEEFDKIPVTTYREHYGHKLSHNSYNSPLNVNSFKWGNKVSITDDHNQTINMKTENLTAQFASLIQLHKTMPKYRYDQISTIFNTHKTTIGNDIINFSWHGVIWNSDLNYGAGGDEETMSVVCIQYDEWFVFACARDFGYVRNADINTWTERASGGVHSFNSGTNCLDLGDGGTGIGLSCVVYERG